MHAQSRGAVSGGTEPLPAGMAAQSGDDDNFCQMGAWFYIVVGLAVLTLWMVVSGTFGFKGSKRGMALTMLCINLPALVVLVLAGGAGAVPSRLLGQRSGPADPVLLSALLRLGAIVAMWTGQVFWFYFGAFLLLVLSSWLGCRAKDPVKK